MYLKEWIDLATAAGTWGLVIFTAWLVWVTTKASKETAKISREAADTARMTVAEMRLGTQLQVFAQMVTQWQAPHMRGLRKEFAGEIKKHVTNGTLGDPALVDETVLEFLESLARFTKDRALDSKHVWNYFSVSVQCYWEATRGMVMAMRRQDNDDGLYMDFEWLAAEFSKLDGEGNPATAPQIPEYARWFGFLISEQYLDGPPVSLLAS